MRMNSCVCRLGRARKGRLAPRGPHLTLVCLLLSFVWNVFSECESTITRGSGPKYLVVFCALSPIALTLNRGVSDTTNSALLTDIADRVLPLAAVPVSSPFFALSIATPVVLFCLFRLSRTSA
jgi:hypothetical protein